MSALSASPFATRTLITFSTWREMARKPSAFIEKADNDAKAPGPDLLLLDMHLPKYDGEAILKRLRSTERYAQIPVVVMTSSDAPQDHDKAQKHAAMFYFRKPSRLEEFIQLGVIVREILTGKKPLGARRSRAGGTR